jgi:PAS domain S-box-containing protein
MILIAVPVLRLLPQSSLIPLLAWWTLLALANFGFARWAEDGRRPELQIGAQSVVDLLVLTGLLHFSGSIENPLYLIYILYVILPGFLLPRKTAFALTVLAGVLFTSLVIGESLGILAHADNSLFPHDKESPAGAQASLFGQPRTIVAPDLVFAVGRVIPFLVVLALTSLAVMTVAARVRRTEQDLQHRQLEGLMDQSGGGIVILDPNLRVQWFNSQVANSLGWSVEALDRPCAGANLPGGCQGECVAVTAMTTQQPAEVDRAVTDENGRQRYLRFTATPVFDQSGRVTQVVEHVEEITEQKALQENAMHNSKLSVLGTVAAGVAHEIRNPVSSLQMRLRLMRGTKDPDYLDESLEVLHTQLGGIERIVNDINQYARPARADREECELGEVLDEAIGIVRFDPRAKRITIRRGADCAALRVLGVRDQLRQVFLNLLLNAVDATPDGGTVSVSVDGRNGSVRAAIRDTGSGMSEQVKSHLFEPFFTTKSDGTGLGLAISLSLIRAHGGTIDVESEPGKGSSFIVELPAA